MDNSSISWKNRGNSLYKVGDYQSAISFYNSGLQIDPENTDLLHNKSKALAKLGRHMEAKQCQEKIKSISNKSLHVNEISLEKNSDIELESSSTPINTVQEVQNQPDQSILNKTLNFFDKIAETAKTNARKVAYNHLLKQHKKHVKKLIIAEFRFYDLNKMCVFFNIGEPHPYRVNNRGDRISIKPTFNHWADYALDNISYENLRSYAESKHKITQAIVEHERKYKQERQRKYPEFEKTDETTLRGLSADSCDEEFFNKLIEVIKEYRPIKPFYNEILYHTNLYTYLCEKIPGEIGFEEQRGSSRPDITIGDIAIEVKGPTNAQALVTIADKINRYTLQHDHLIVVLFDVQISDQLTERFYDEWYERIMQIYKEHVTIIRK
jgi:tetratricopeptide (TPR) repeat protein